MRLQTSVMMKQAFKWILYRGIPYCVSYPFFKLLGRVEVRGNENLPRKGGILIAANHLSYVDPPLLATMITRGCLFMAKHELFDIPVLRYIIGYYAFPVVRKNPSSSSIKRALQELASGKIVVIFPEGRRNGLCAPLSAKYEVKYGIGMIAVLSKMKVVPTLIEGTDNFLPPGQVIPRPAKIRVTFGKPIEVNQSGADYEKISYQIMNSINSMAHREVECAEANDAG